MKKFNQLSTDEKSTVTAMIYGYFQSIDNPFMRAISMDTVIQELYKVNPNCTTNINQQGQWSIATNGQLNKKNWETIHANCLESVKPAWMR